jgi:hypothetical protein
MITILRKWWANAAATLCLLLMMILMSPWAGLFIVKLGLCRLRDKWRGGHLDRPTPFESKE